MSEQAGNTSPLLELTLTRMREFLREPEAVFWSLVFPILLAASLGLAFPGSAATKLRVAATTPQWADALSSEPLLDARQLPLKEAEEALRVGGVVLVVEPNSGGGVAFRYDTANADARLARLVADRAVQRSGGQTDPVPIFDVTTAEKGGRYIDFLIPGLLGMNLLSGAIWGVGYTIVDTRRRNLLKRLVATPMSRTSYLVSFLIHRLLLMVIEGGSILAFGVWAFHVPLQGPFSVLVLVCILTTLASTALGLLIAARIRTIEGATGLMNFVVIPMWMASGVFFSADRFPQFLHPFINLLPLTASTQALRANILLGANLAQIFPQLAILAAWMVVCFVLALATFRWR